MKTLAPTTVQLFTVLCSLVLVLASVPALAGDPSYDVQFASDEATSTPCNVCGDSSGCYSCTPAPYNDGYCINCPLSDELMRRLEIQTAALQAHGITYNFDVAQFYQGVASGGREQEFDYGGKVDQFLILDGGKLGLWQGMMMAMHVETRFGDDVNLDASGFAPANIAMLYRKDTIHDIKVRSAAQRFRL